MKPSTVVELAGFACLAAAGFVVSVLVGLVVSGLALLLIGYATEDNAAAVAVVRMIIPFRRRLERVKLRRSNRRRIRRESRRRRLFERSPAEVLVRVRGE